ncbi:MAG: phenylalanine--tRNA ligase subunit alpha [Alphaproteobacteria bacterium]
MDNFTELRKEIIEIISKANDIKTLEEARVATLGKKGIITNFMKNLAGMAPEERKNAGKELNIIKDEASAEIEKRKNILEKEEINQKLINERIDVSLPPRFEKRGKIHPTTQIYEEVVAVFSEMGFAVAEGPDIEDDFHNFTALNIPEAHPARQMHDTFYLSGSEDGAVSKLLRTHTSPVQIRTMTSVKPPIKIIAPGRTYRCDSDMTHTPMFHQVEGLVIDKNTTMAHLKGCLLEFIKTIFEVDDVPVRLRPSFFPFTEPSAELDVKCSRRDGAIAIGEGDDWLEILGCGMVHPNVLKNCGIDPNEYQGFAFGLGLDRLAMLKYGIPDLRTFFDTDIRWIDHYGFLPLDVPSVAGGLSMTKGVAK